MDEFNYSFSEIASQTHKDRMHEELHEKMNIENATNKAWNGFCFWARLNNNNDLSLTSFKKYIDTDFFGKNIAGYVVKNIYEKHYGFEFEWDFENGKWKIKK